MPLTSEVQRKAGESQKSTQVGLLCRELTNIISQLKICLFCGGWCDQNRLGILFLT